MAATRPSLAFRPSHTSAIAAIGTEFQGLSRLREIQMDHNTLTMVRNSQRACNSAAAKKIIER